MEDLNKVIDMTKKKVKKKEFRVVDPPKHLYEWVDSLAKDNRRTMPAQLITIIEEAKIRGIK